MNRRLVIALAMLLAAAAAGAPAASGAVERASATAFAVQIAVPGEEATTVAASSAPPLRFGTAGTIAYPEDGSVLKASSSSTAARTGPGAGARSGAEAVVRDVSLFGGEIEIDRVSLDASAVATRTVVQGSLAASQVEGLVVLGEPVAVSVNLRVTLADWGYAVVLEQAVLQEDGQVRGYRGFVTGLHVYLTAEHGGLPAGSEILIGYAEAAAEAPPAAEEPPPAPPDGGEPGSSPDGDGPDASPLPQEPTLGPPGATRSGPPAIVLNPPPGVQPQITGQGYVFPVYGPASFTNDFAASRANTGWHHGNDIFAPLGAPVLAVADGTLFLVGWNGVGGHRLWLRDGQGNEYYYAHLSAYSPLAFDGAQVEAGDVIGFVGDSGDALGTPYHLHFEIHPAGLLGLGYDGVVNPYSYLLAWYGREDVGVFASSAPLPAPRPATVILQAEDIAAASGLEPGALERAYGLPLLVASAAGLVSPEPPALVGLEPGFASLH
jgi:hypothetical protein